VTPLRVGDPAPRFELRDQHGATVGPSTYPGRSVVVMFYPFAFSRVCGDELQGVQDRLASFQSEAVQLLAVSCDPVFSLRAYAERDGLGFPLLSDFWPHGTVARAYGVLDDQSGSARRSTFVVDHEGVLRWRVDNAPGEARDLDEQVRVLATL